MKDFLSSWWGITIICVIAIVLWISLSALLYRKFFKRFYDFLLSGIALIILSPVLLLLTLIGAIKMKGNPFFTQARPGKKEKIFKMIKFRTMTCEKDAEGNLLPDEKRLTKYGKFLRSTSLDELPELFNIFIGNMSIVGPRPLLVQYLPLYNDEQKHRHDVRPGLTGYAQVNGRNAISWEEKFKLDVYYTKNISLAGDIKILFQTVSAVFKRSGISQEGHATMEYFTGEKKSEEINVLILSAGRRVELVNCFKAARDRLNINGKVFTADISTTAPALYFADGYFIIPRISADDYIDKLIEVCRDNKISLVVPTIDTELEILSSNKQRIQSESGAIVCVSDFESVSVCCDKLKSAKFFEEHGFGYPRVIGEKEIKAGEFTYPLFIKPRDGSSSINAFKIENRKELEFFSEYVKNPIIQEFVSGKEYTVDCFSDFDGKIISVVPRLRIATRSGEVLKGRTEKNAVIVEDVKRLLQ
nr:sugar transferase [Clostridia bacterium]